MSYSIEQTAPVMRPVRSGISPLQRRVEAVLENIGLLLTLLFIMLPIFWMALTAFKQRADVFTLKVFFTPTLQNFVAIFQEPLAFGPLLWNSVVIAGATVLI